MGALGNRRDWERAPPCLSGRVLRYFWPPGRGGGRMRRPRGRLMGDFAATRGPAVSPLVAEAVFQSFVIEIAIVLTPCPPSESTQNDCACARILTKRSCPHRDSILYAASLRIMQTVRAVRTSTVSSRQGQTGIRLYATGAETNMVACSVPNRSAEFATYPRLPCLLRVQAPVLSD